MSEENRIPFNGKIAVATNDLKRVTGHIGRCRAFRIFEIKENKIINSETRENNFTNHRRGGHQHHHEGRSGDHQGHGRHSHQRLIEGLIDCNVLISRGGGWRVVEDLKKHNIITVFTDVDQIEDAVNLFINGKLKNEADLVCD
ncbi:MAG: hypothetical protein Kow0098_02020 [Ignavibacteriaceae bacterium]